jgi:hypothetical protein
MLLARYLGTLLLPRALLLPRGPRGPFQPFGNTFTDTCVCLR